MQTEQSRFEMVSNFGHAVLLSKLHFVIHPTPENRGSKNTFFRVIYTNVYIFHDFFRITPLYVYPRLHGRGHVLTYYTHREGVTCPVAFGGIPAVCVCCVCVDAVMQL